MRVAIYEAWSSIPARVFNVVLLVCASWPVGNPRSFQRFWNWVVSPEQVRLVGASVVAVCLLYWLVLYLLRPRKRPEVAEPERTPFIRVKGSIDASTITGNRAHGPLIDAGSISETEITDNKSA